MKHKHWKARLYLITGIGLIAFFIFGLAPIILQSETAQPLIKHIQESDIDSGALYYTESPESGEVEFYLRKADAFNKKNN